MEESVNLYNISLYIFITSLLHYLLLHFHIYSYILSFLRDTSMVVFLNKQDILEKKIIEGKKMGNYFPDYSKFQLDSVRRKNNSDKKNSVKPEVDRARSFIQKMFVDATESKNNKPDFNMSDDETESDITRQCYFHFTVATDTENIKVVFKACQQIILIENLKNGSL